MKIDYSAFIEICHVNDPRNFGGFHIKTSGLYTIVPDDDAPLSPTERAVLSWHPTGIHENPALPLPCTLEELHSFVADAGLLRCIDEDAVTAMSQEARDTAEVQAAYDETGLNGEAINWRYWVHQMPALNAMQTACLMSALEPDIFANLNGRPGKADPAKNIDKAKKIQRLAEAQGKLTASPAEWVGWAQAQSLEVHTGFLLAVEEFPETTSVRGDSAPAAKLEAVPVTSLSGDDIPGKMPRTAIGKLAIKTAWQIECRTGKQATPNQVIEKMQALIEIEPELIYAIPHGVRWVTTKGKDKPFDIEACAKALDIWNRSRP